MSKYWVITKEVYKKNVKSFGFIAMVLSPLIVMLFIGGLIYYFSREDVNQEPVQIALISEEAGLSDAFQAGEWNLEVDESVTSESEAEEALVNEAIVGYLVIESEEDTLSIDIVHAGELSEYIPMFSELFSNYQTMLRAGTLDLTPDQVMSLSEPVELNERQVSIVEETLTTEDTTDTMVQQFGAYFVSIAIMIFIMTYAGIIAEEVASEKGTRIMEIILSSASVTSHFFGKLTGVMLILLTQLGLYAAVGLGVYFYFRNSDFVQQITQTIDIGALLQELMGFTIIFFIAGVLMYVVLAAFFGSLATKMEDVNKAVTPIVFLALAGFYVGLFAFNVPDHMLNVVFSYIPLFTPFVMPFRIAAGTVSTLGIWLSVVGTIAFALLISVVSLAFYRSNVLIYSDTNIIGTIKRSWSIMKSNKQAKRRRVA